MVTDLMVTWPRLIACGISVIAVGCSSLPSSMRQSTTMPEARVPGTQDRPQKVVFSPIQVRFRGERSWTLEYLVLPAGWKAFRDGCDVDWCWGTIEPPSDPLIRWAGGLVSSGLDSSGAEVLWRRAQEHPRLRYGVIRQLSQMDELVIEVQSLVLRTRAQSEAQMDRVIQVARSATSTVSPCRECVRPSSRR